MAANKKPRKAYQSRAPSVPMQKSTRDSIALDLHLAVEALISAPSPDTYNQLVKMVEAIQRTGMQGDSLRLAMMVLTEICNRYDRVKKVGVSLQEEIQLRQASSGLDEMIGRIPMNEFRAAVAGVSIDCVLMGA